VNFGLTKIKTKKENIMGSKKKAREITAKYTKDSKRYKTFSIGKKGEEIVGTIYVEKGKDLPENLSLSFEE